MSSINLFLNVMNFITGIYVGVVGLSIYKTSVNSAKMDEFIEETQKDLNLLRVQRATLDKMFDEMAEERKKAFDEKIKDK